MRAFSCFICEEVIERGEPFSNYLFLPTHTEGDTPIPIPVHISCSLNATAGQVADIVLQGMEDGSTPIHFVPRGSSLRQELARLTARWVEDLLKGST